MEVNNSTLVFKKTHVAPKEKLVSSVDKETVERHMDHYPKPSKFFRGAVLAFTLSLPFWGVLFWFIFT